ncbi:MAG: hypothetical protein ACK4IB_05515 [Erythrobacter sp.]
MRLRGDNDNSPAPGSGVFDPLLVDALRHFANHGLDAAPRARQAAASALANGSRNGFDHWVGITALFDPRLARQTERAARSAQD